MQRSLFCSAILIVLSYPMFVHASTTAAPLAATAAIAPQPLINALDEFVVRTGMQVVYRSELAADVQSKGADSGLSPEKTLEQLLRDTGLRFEFINANTVAIRKRDESLVSGALDRQSLVVAEGDSAPPGQNGVGNSQSPDSSSAQNTESAFKSSETTSLEEVVVTAQKRKERLQDVPVPVTVVSTEHLAASNLLRLQEYYAQVPGLNLTPSTQSGQILSIRGISAGSGNPTVGITVDDVSFGSSTFLGGAAVVPDIDPADLERIEVLRGPQGTLYGASSIGGLVKFVTADPSTAGLGGQIRGVTSGVHHGDGPGYSLRGSVNVPVTDTLALRASGFTRRDPGFIDNPTLGIEGIDEADAGGGRLSALWRPRDSFSLKFGALFQKISADGSSDVFPALGDLQQVYIRNSGGYDRKAQAYSAVLAADLGKVHLTSISGYNINEFADSFDGTFAFGPSTQAAFGVPGTPQFNRNSTRKFSEELRFSGPLAASVDWLFGAFYTDEDSSYRQTRWATNPSTGAVAGTVSVLSFPTTYEEQAIFGDLTFHLTERFDVQLGARQGWISQTYSSVFTDRLGVVTSVPELSVDTNAFTYLATAQYKFSPNLMAYTRLASGYRAGGPNVVTGAGSASLAFDPDDSRDYEIGLKGDFLGHALTVDASVYYIDWKDIQLTLRDPVTLQSYTDNAGAARSQGVELSVELRPLTGLTIAAWGAYNDAELTEAFPSTSTVLGLSGDRLPFGSKRSGNLSVRQEFPVTANIEGFVGGSAAHVGDRLGRFTASTRDSFPSYTRLDLTVGLRFNIWTANIFVNNLADKRGVLASGLAPGTRVYIQPRMVGLSVAADF